MRPLDDGSSRGRARFDRHAGAHKFYLAIARNFESPGLRRKSWTSVRTAGRRFAPITSAACCGRRRCARRFGVTPPRRSTTPSSPRIQDAMHPRRGAHAGGDRARGRDRRRVPPRLLLGAVRGAHQGPRDARRRCSSFATTTATRSISPRPMRQRKMRRTQPLALDEFVFLRGDHQGDAEDHAAGAVDHALPALHRLRRPHVYAGRRELLRRSGRGLPQEIADLVAGRLPLPAARRGRRRAAVRSRASARQVAGGGRRSRRAGRPLHRRHQPARSRPPGRRRGRRAHVPRQLQGPLSRRRRLRVGRRAVLQPAPTPIISCSSTTRRAPAISRRCASCRRARASCSASSAARRPRWKASTGCKRRVEEAAEIHRPRPAGDQPAMRLRQHVRPAIR